MKKLSHYENKTLTTSLIQHERNTKRKTNPKLKYKILSTIKKLRKKLCE